MTKAAVLKTVAFALVIKRNRGFKIATVETISLKCRNFTHLRGFFSSKYASIPSSKKTPNIRKLGYFRFFEV